MKIPIALQLFSVREDTAKDMLGVLKKVAAMGYDGVEFAGYAGHAGPDLRKALDDLGLKCPSTHTGIDLLSPENLTATCELHNVLGAKWIVIPWMPEEKRATPDACKATGEYLTELIEKVKPYGLSLGFHAHHADMHPLEGGKSAWYLLAENTPTEFAMQYDTANGMAGGADPVKPILDLPGRGQSVHLKEYKDGHGPIIGEGDVPWEKVFEACESVAGTQWYVVEHESELEIPPIEAVEKCLQNLRSWGK